LLRRDDLQGIESSEVAARPESVGKRQESNGISKEVRSLEGDKALKRVTPRTLEPEIRFRGFGRRKPLRGPRKP
jgi:hypothetical protein